jgi:predicted NBD/HSP70 family sugar kinase
VARRIALHIAPLAAVADVSLVVLGGGIGANDLLLRPVGELLAEWLPYPRASRSRRLARPRSSPAPLAVGLAAARDNVFTLRLAEA